MKPHGKQNAKRKKDLVAEGGVGRPQISWDWWPHLLEIRRWKAPEPGDEFGMNGEVLAVIDDRLEYQLVELEGDLYCFHIQGDPYPTSKPLPVDSLASVDHDALRRMVRVVANLDLRMRQRTPEPE